MLVMKNKMDWSVKCFPNVVVKKLVYGRETGIILTARPCFATAIVW